VPKKTILCAEDEPLVARQIKSALQRNYDIVEAGDGRTAWVMIGERNPDLVLADATLPLLSGWDLVRRMNSDPETRGTPIIILIEKDTLFTRLFAKLMGVFALVKKPIANSRLQETVKAALGER